MTDRQIEVGLKEAKKLSNQFDMYQPVLWNDFILVLEAMREAGKERTDEQTNKRSIETMSTIHD